MIRKDKYSKLYKAHISTVSKLHTNQFLMVLKINQSILYI